MRVVQAVTLDALTETKTNAWVSQIANQITKHPKSTASTDSYQRLLSHPVETG